MDRIAELEEAVKLQHDALMNMLDALEQKMNSNIDRLTREIAAYRAGSDKAPKVKPPKF